MDWKKIGRMILFPPVWLLALQTIAAAAALVWIFLNGMAEQWYAYGIYVLSFYTLVTDCAFLVLVLPKHCRRIKQAVYDNPLGNRYLTDKVFRARVSLYLSLGINLLYVGLQGVQWYLFRSWWFVVLAAYYVILSLMRFFCKVISFLDQLHIRIRMIFHQRANQFVQILAYFLCHTVSPFAHLSFQMVELFSQSA